MFQEILDLALQKQAKRGHIALSFSRLSNYEQCPRQFAAKYITKTYPDDSDNPNFVHGNNIHKQLEEAVVQLRDTKKIHSKHIKCVQDCHTLINNLIKSYPYVFTEQQLAVNKDWSEIDWFSRAAYYRAILDLILIDADFKNAFVIDWKSGKVRDYDDSPTGQLVLAACVLFSLKPELEAIDIAYMFVEHKQTIRRQYFRKDLAKMKAPFDEKFGQVNSDKVFKPKTNQYCYFCDISPAHCEYKKV